MRGLGEVAFGWQRAGAASEAEKAWHSGCDHAGFGFAGEPGWVRGFYTGGGA